MLGFKFLQRKFLVKKCVFLGGCLVQKKCSDMNLDWQHDWFLFIFLHNKPKFGINLTMINLICINISNQYFINAAGGLSNKTKYFAFKISFILESFTTHMLFLQLSCSWVCSADWTHSPWLGCGYIRCIWISGVRDTNRGKESFVCWQGWRLLFCWLF